jgi:hypothetical protein
MTPQEPRKLSVEISTFELPRSVERGTGYDFGIYTTFRDHPALMGSARRGAGVGPVGCRF